MRAILSTLFGACLAVLLAGPARAADAVPLDTSLEIPAAPDEPCGGCTAYLPRFWGEVDYLMVWAKAAPVPILATTGPATILGPAGFPGVSGLPGTGPVLGGENVVYNPASGVRGVLGGWLDDDCRLGVEAAYFRVFERSEPRTVTGTTPLSIPFFNAAIGTEDSVGIAFAREIDPLAGGLSLSLTTRVQGFEVNGLLRLREQQRSRLDLLFGYRYISLNEGLFLDSSSSVVGQNNVFRTSDSFRADNEFHGGQVGLRQQLYLGRLFFRGTAKVALGNVHQQTDIAGSLLTDTFPGLIGRPRRFNGGYLALPSNSGRFATDRFAVVPEATAGVGLHVRDGLRVTLSYTFLYLSTVARPGDQIDRVINPTQGPAFTNTPGAALQGPPRPMFLGASNEYWLQGLSIGVEARF